MELAETCYGNSVLHTCLNQRKKKYNLAGKPVHKLDTGKQWNIYQFFEILGL